MSVDRKRIKVSTIHLGKFPAGKENLPLAPRPPSARRLQGATKTGTTIESKPWASGVRASGQTPALLSPWSTEGPASSNRPQLSCSKHPSESHMLGGRPNENGRRTSFVRNARTVVVPAERDCQRREAHGKAVRVVQTHQHVHVACVGVVGGTRAGGGRKHKWGAVGPVGVCVCLCVCGRGKHPLPFPESSRALNHWPTLNPWHRDSVSRAAVRAPSAAQTHGLLPELAPMGHGSLSHKRREHPPGER